MPGSPPEGEPQIYPRLAYRDPTEAVAWLGRVFGLEEREAARLSTEDGDVAIAWMELGAGLVMIGRAGTHGLESPATLGAGTQMVIGYVDDVDEHYERAKREGARIVMDLDDQPWGDRRYEASDLEGHRWHFAEHLRDVPAAEWRPRSS